ncbi:hypothetical protein Misp04_59550 [Micromonospora sp. NBRC 101691]|nr:hypothetical protein Misp04_59550 [Micromonospora sp. NBRC 101691]
MATTDPAFPGGPATGPVGHTGFRPATRDTDARHGLRAHGATGRPAARTAGWRFRRPGRPAPAQRPADSASTTGAPVCGTWRSAPAAGPPTGDGPQAGIRWGTRSSDRATARTRRSTW